MEYTVKATIEGIAPILFNRFSEAAQADMEAGRNKARQTVEAKREEARKSKVYRNTNGLFCPSRNLKKAIVLACSSANLKYGNRKGLGPYLDALMRIDPLEIPFGCDEAEYIDEQSGRIPPRTGARVVLYRPALKAGWHLSFEMTIAEDIIDQSKVHEALIAAGIYKGICDGRPEYGRFTVTSFEVVKKAKK